MKSWIWWRQDVPAATTADDPSFSRTCGNKLPFANGAGNFEVVFRVAERSRHAAAAGIEIDHG